MIATRDDLVITKWGARFSGLRFPCAIGRGGIGEKRGEGDSITPRGVHRLQYVITRPDRPVPTLPLPVVTSGPQDGWGDDPADPAGYNRPICRPYAASHERLRRADPLYDLVGVMDYNRDPITPGGGSAIFLHVWRRPRYPTEGCIAFDPGDLLAILSRWTPRSRILIQ
ncbi:L,D-transpeptidase family protein [Paracoccaceae bacterium GXU_MW_L88]